MRSVMRFCKKTLCACCFIGSGMAYADVLGLTIRAEQWRPETELYAGDHLSSQALSMQKSSDLMVRVAFEHPIPLLPNIALQRQQVNTEGQGMVSGLFRLNNQTYPPQSQISQQLSMISSDVLFYYELLDTPLIALDLGASLRQLDATLSVDSPISARQRLTTFLPLAYFSGHIYFWGTDTSVFWQGHYTDLNDQRWFEGRLGLTYEFIDFTVMSMALQLGWQLQDMKIINKDQLDFSSTMRGPFIALEIDF